MRSFVYDTVQPTGVVDSSGGLFTRFAPIPFSVVWSEDVQNFAEGDVTVTNGALTASSFTQVTAFNYTFTVDPTAEGAVTVQVRNNTPKAGQSVAIMNMFYRN